MTKDGREIARYFYDKTELKSTERVFFANVSAADALLKAGYTKEQIIETIDYLLLNPPKNGFNSIAYIQYVINEILIKIKVKKEMENPTLMEIDDSALGGENKKKYERQGKTDINKFFKL